MVKILEPLVEDAPTSDSFSSEMVSDYLQGQKSLKKDNEIYSGCFSFSGCYSPSSCIDCYSTE